jgi:LPXTG-motif cell wall-anchored protein
VVGMQPATGLALQAEAVGETVATPDAVGTVDVSLVWFRTQTQQQLTVVGSVLLFGDCALPPDTTAVPDTTIPVTDPTVVATAPQTTIAVGSGGGNLPHAGSDDTLLYLGGGLVMIGVSLLIVRRRSYLTD